MSIRTDDLGFVFYEADEQEEKELEYVYALGSEEPQTRFSDYAVLCNAKQMIRQPKSRQSRIRLRLLSEIIKNKRNTIY